MKKSFLRNLLLENYILLELEVCIIYNNIILISKITIFKI